MNIVRIVTLAESLRWHVDRPATGQVWLDLDGQPYPAAGWDDFVVVILRALAKAVTRALRHPGGTAKALFMEGSYELNFSFAAGDRLEIACGEWDKAPKLTGQVSPEELAASLLAAAEPVVGACLAAADAESASAPGVARGRAKQPTGVRDLRALRRSLDVLRRLLEARSA